MPGTVDYADSWSSRPKFVYFFIDMQILSPEVPANLFNKPNCHM